jgi:hypothetical protein
MSAPNVQPAKAQPNAQPAKAQPNAQPAKTQPKAQNQGPTNAQAPKSHTKARAKTNPALLATYVLGWQLSRAAFGSMPSEAEKEPGFEDAHAGYIACKAQCDANRHVKVQKHDKAPECKFPGCLGYYSDQCACPFKHTFLGKYRTNIMVLVAVVCTFVCTLVMCLLLRRLA